VVWWKSGDAIITGVELTPRDEVAVGNKLLRVATEPRLRHPRGGLAVLLVRVDYGDDFEIRLINVLMDALHVRGAATAAAADLRDADAGVSADDALIFCGGQDARSRGNHGGARSEGGGGFQEGATGKGIFVHGNWVKGR
jgi:hypothetical protein